MIFAFTYTSSSIINVYKASIRQKKSLLALAVAPISTPRCNNTSVEHWEHVMYNVKIRQINRTSACKIAVKYNLVVISIHLKKYFIYFMYWAPNEAFMKLTITWTANIPYVVRLCFTFPPQRLCLRLRLRSMSLFVLLVFTTNKIPQSMKSHHPDLFKFLWSHVFLEDINSVNIRTLHIWWRTFKWKRCFEIPPSLMVAIYKMWDDFDNE